MDTASTRGIVSALRVRLLAIQTPGPANKLLLESVRKVSAACSDATCLETLRTQFDLILGNGSAGLLGASSTQYDFRAVICCAICLLETEESHSKHHTGSPNLCLPFLKDICIGILALCDRVLGTKTLPDDPMSYRDAQVRWIGGIQIDFTSDVVPLNKKEWLSSTILDVWAAHLTEAYGQEMSSDFWVLSPWLACLANPNAYNESAPKERQVHDIINTAASGRRLLDRPRWGLPIRSTNKYAQHWVFAWVDFRLQKLFVFDSLRKATSKGWVFEVLAKILNYLLAHQGEKTINFSKWTTAIVTPEPGNEQRNGWACGYFALSAMEAFARNASTDVVTAYGVEWARTAYSDLYRSLPLHPFREKLLGLNSGADAVGSISSQSTSSVEFLDEGSSHNEIELLPPSAAPLLAQAIEAKNEAFLTDMSYSVKKRIRQDTPQSETSSIAESLKPCFKTNKRRKETAARAPRKKLEERQRQFLEDPYIVKVDNAIKGDAYEVYCVCDASKPRKLGNRSKPEQEWAISNWRSHQKTCPALKGDKKKKKSQVVAGKHAQIDESHKASNKSISSFFQSLAKKTEPVISQASALPQAMGEHASTRSRPNHRITSFFAPFKRLEVRAILFKTTMGSDSEKSKQALELQPCVGLGNTDYGVYASQQMYAHRQGGVPANQWVYEARSIMPYKTWPTLKEEGRRVKMNLSGASEITPTHDEHKRLGVPVTTNGHAARALWTKREVMSVHEALNSCGKWAVDPDARTVHSTTCAQRTDEMDSICMPCKRIETDEGFKRAVRESKRVATLSSIELEEHIKNRAKYTPHIHFDGQAALTSHSLDNPSVMKLIGAITNGPSSAFLTLYEQAKNGQLDSANIFTEICKQFADRNARVQSGPNALRGIRYSPEFVDFCTIARSVGGRTSVQYGILKEILGGVSHRTLRKRVQQSGAGLVSPILIEDNFLRLVQFAKLVGYEGPWVACGDGTKITPMLNVSTAFAREGAHLVGSTLPLEETHFVNAEQQTAVTKKIEQSSALANQVWVQGMMIPLPGMPLFAVAMRPNKGGFKSSDYLASHLLLRDLASKAGIKVLSTGADGAATEFKAHKLLRQTSGDSRLLYLNKKFGIHVSCPIWDTTGPLVTVSDPPHARKGVKTNMESGTHLITLGSTYICHSVLMELLKIPGCPLFIKDVYNSDKQDDGAARRLLHPSLLPLLLNSDGELRDQQFKGFFIVNLVFGSGIDAWMKRDMSHIDRVVCSARMWAFLVIFRQHLESSTAEFPDLFNVRRNFFSAESTEIWLALFHQMILLLLAHSEYYTGIPFMPWHHGTPAMEHFFGMCRLFVADFSYSQLLGIYKHAELRQQLLATGKYSSKREKDSNNGYSFDPWINNLSETELEELKSIPTRAQIDSAVEIGWNEAVALAQLCDVEAPKLPLREQDLPLCLRKDYALSRATTLPGGATVSIPVASPDSGSGSDSDMSLNLEEQPTIIDPDTAAIPMPNEVTILPSTSGCRFDSSSQALMATAALRVAQSCAIDAEIMEADELLAKARDTALATDDGLGQTQGRMSIQHLLNPPSAAPPAAPISVPTFLPAGYPLTPLTWAILAGSRQSSAASTNVNSERIRNLKPNVKYASGKFSPNAAAHQLSNDINESEMLRAETAVQKSRYQRWTHRAEPIATKIGCELSKTIGDLQLPNVSSAGVSEITPLALGSLVVMLSSERWYLGEILGIYSRGAASSRHDSYTDASSTKGLTYLSLKVFIQAGTLNIFEHVIHRTPLFTHAPAAQLVFLLHGVKLARNERDSTAHRAIQGAKRSRKRA
ncbi:hypothetical protein BDV93DRAFT_561745 [Ceratobasidium sp. AG-I]|nr:hypothetical protein BDV93DRAFT_561745 [Ceratobasidium sp. AG-I]